MASETEISRERAKRILETAGRADEYDPLADYYVATDDEGDELLMQGGLDDPLCDNRTSTSWLGSW